MLHGCITVLLSISSLFGQNAFLAERSTPSGDRWMKIGVASFATGQALDIASSWNKRELNTFLGSRLPDGRCCVFDAKGLAIKAGAATAITAVFWLAGRAMPEHRGKFGKALTILGLGSAGLSIHNFQQPRGR